MLSVYSLIKPPAYGNCTVTEEKFNFICTVAEIKNIYKGSNAKKTMELEKLKSRLDKILIEKDWKVEKVIEQDYSTASVIDCIIYYVTSFLFSIYVPKYRFCVVQLTIIEACITILNCL